MTSSDPAVLKPAKIEVGGKEPEKGPDGAVIISSPDPVRVYVWGRYGHLAQAKSWREENTGGHKHPIIDDPRVRGKFSSSNIEFQQDGWHWFNFYPGDFAGNFVVEVWYYRDGPERLDSRTTLEIIPTGFQKLSHRVLLHTTPPLDPKHPEPHWTSVAFAQKLLGIPAQNRKGIVDRYYEDTDGKKLTLASASLVGGGMYDLNGDWNAPYDEKDGKVVILKKTPDIGAEEMKLLRRLCTKEYIDVIDKAGFVELRMLPPSAEPSAQNE